MSESMTVIAERFVRQGWVEVEGAIDAAYCEARVQHGFERLGMTATPSTWPTGWHNTAPTDAPPIDRVAPRAADVLHDLVGGPDAISFAGIPDNLIFNFPDPDDEWWPAHRWDAPGAGYHKDGDWFRHFLDSPEQAILGTSSGETSPSDKDPPTWPWIRSARSPGSSPTIPKGSIRVASR